MRQAGLRAVRLHCFKCRADRNARILGQSDAQLLGLIVASYRLLPPMHRNRHQHVDTVQETRHQQVAAHHFAHKPPQLPEMMIFQVVNHACQFRIWRIKEEPRRPFIRHYPHEPHRHRIVLNTVVSCARQPRQTTHTHVTLTAFQRLAAQVAAMWQNIIQQ